MALTLTPEVETVVEEQARRQIVQQQGRAAAASKEDALPCHRFFLYAVALPTNEGAHFGLKPVIIESYADRTHC